MSAEQGNLAQVREELAGGYVRGQIVDYSPRNPESAEIVPGARPLWHLIETHPQHERIAAAHLIARRFGIFVPETEADEVRRGRKLHVTRLMFTGYLFVWVWSLPHHWGRLQTAPGVKRVITRLTADGREEAVVIGDDQIDVIRAVENRERPLPEITVDEVRKSKKDKKRWKKASKRDKEMMMKERERGNEIVACYPWSPFQHDLITLDGHGRNQALRKALGLS